MAKSQIKMFETISVLIVFFFILVFGLVYYNNSQAKEIRKIMDENSQLKAMEIMKVVNNLPELQCSMDNIQTTNCFELVKLENFKEIVDNNKQYYSTIFSYSDIMVRQIYPVISETQIYHYEKPKNSLSNQTNFIPILVYDSVKRRYNAGMLVVEVYS